MRKRWLILAAVISYLAVSSVAGILLTEMSLRPGRRALDKVSLSRMIEASAPKAQESVQIESHGVQLRAWYVVPANDNGEAVILLHGLSDNREGVSGYARMFMKHGYRVLLPDARAHGESEGQFATYGVLERADLREWSEWLDGRGASCVYGFGESMGAALIAQAIAAEPKLCAVVAESTFSTFREVAYDRISFETHIPLLIAQTVGAPAVEVGLTYAKWKYGIDLANANPAEAVHEGAVPVMLIAGSRDRLIRARHSEAMANENPDKVELWELDVDHGGAVGANPSEFERRVVRWFEIHARKRQ